MTTGAPRDPIASVRGRLEQAARRRGEDFQVTLLRYGVERLLFRLSDSPHRTRFVLKGAMLFEVWGAHAHRATRDLDLLGVGTNSEHWLREVFESLCRSQVESDALVFEATSLRIDRIHEAGDYEGWRVTLLAQLGRTRIPIPIDIAYGQAVNPPAEEIEYPGLLELPRARILAYPREVTIAEKFHAIVSLGIANGRMKDFFDLAHLAGTFQFESERLAQALRATFERRVTAIPAEPPTGLTSEYFEDPDRLRDWHAFIRRAGVDGGSLAHACQTAEALLMPVCAWAREPSVPRRNWTPGKGWVPTSARATATAASGPGPRLKR